MTLSIGILGLPNVGKSTLFQALTKKQVDIANYPFTTINPNVGVVAVPDARLEKITELIKPEKSLAATVEFVDIAGLVKGAHRGEGLGNQFLSHVYSVDAILFLVRCFKDKNVAWLTESPERELEILKEELAKKDEEIEKRESDTPALSNKLSIIIGNTKSEGENLDCQNCDLKIDAKLELEMADMSESEIKELGLEPRLHQLIRKTYEILNLITFYTIKGGKEVRAWPVKKGTPVVEAGGVVHSDFQEKFVRADVIGWDKLLESGSWAVARERGWIRSEGRGYEVQDGDVIEFKI